MFGISDSDLIAKDKIKIVNGIAGSGKSTETVNTLRRLNQKFCLASFSNALKFAAYDKFNCDVDTICGLAFTNTPYPRAAEKDVDNYDTVILDEILLDGVECLNWIRHHVGKVNIIALTDSRQMLNADDSRAVLREFNRMTKQKDVIYVDVDVTRRARDKETEELYSKLYNTDSNKLFTVEEVKELYGCDVVNIRDIDYNPKNAYICHSNMIEHEIYKMYDIANRADVNVIPKNHISRNRKADRSKYPVCDQLTAEDKKINAYFQADDIGSATRYQGREVDKNDECYFILKQGDIITGREAYTVLTRCQSVKSMHIAMIDIAEKHDLTSILGIPVVKVKTLNIDTDDKTYKNLQIGTMASVIKKYGDEDVAYNSTMVTSGDNVIYSTLSNNALKEFSKIEGDEVKLNKVIHKTTKTIKSIVKKDVTMHFDFMDEVYEILKRPIMVPRIRNSPNASKKQFGKLCDIYSAFPTILKTADMPAAGYLYREYDPNLLNFYIYKGHTVTHGSIITEELANKIGDSEYVFSTKKQAGCELGRYTYELCHKDKESKKRINKDFLWGRLESGYYKRELAIVNGKQQLVYCKCPQNNLQLVGCALWSKLSLIMLEAIESIGAKRFYIVTDGLYYNGDDIPKLPEWCDYRIEDLTAPDNGSDEKYKNVIYKTYEDPKTKAEKERERKRAAYANMTPEQKEERIRKQRERRAAKKAEKEASSQ